MPVDPPTLKAWLSDGHEIALLDVREHGQYGMGHLFFAVPLPYSRFELGLGALAPNRAVRLVLCDGGDGVAARAAARAAALGYTNVFVLEGGVPAWGAAGLHDLCGRERTEQGVRRDRRASAPHAADRRARARGDAGAGRQFRHRRRPAVGRIPQDEHPRRHLLPERRARAAHPRHRARSADQDRGELRRPHPLDHRCPDPDRLRRPQSRLRAGERHAGLVSRRARARAQRRSPLRRSRCRDGGAAIAGADVRAGVRRFLGHCGRGPCVAR